MKRLERFLPAGAAFVAGFAVMSLEILGSRLLAPAFGSSVLVWTNIIAVILVALAVGAWAGGVLADRYPTKGIVAVFFVGAGLWSLGLAAVARFILPFFTLFPSAFAAPLAASGFLAFPAFLLGAVSPAVLRLAVTDLARTGHVAGRLSAVGTLGSLLGTYLTGYALLPRYAVSDILYGLAIALILVAAGVSGRLFGKRVVLPVTCLAFAAFPLSRASLFVTEDIIPSAYAHVSLRDLDYHGVSARGLVINYGLHAASAPSAPERTILDYAQGMRAVDAVVGNPRSMLALGGGGFHVAREFAARHSEATVDVVEIDPAVVVASERAFGFVPDDRIRVRLNDARDELKRLPSGYDVLIQDTYAGDLSVPWHLMTREAFAEYKRLLASDGVFLANVIMRDDPTTPAAERFQADFAATMREAFRWSFAIAILNADTAGHPVNVLVFAGNGREPDRDAVLKAVEKESGVPVTFTNLRDGGRVWTDDFGPADFESLAMYREAYEKP